MKKVFLQTWGCQMNEHDSERMLELLAKEGYVQAHDARGADLILLNTCSVREKAVQKVRSAVGTFRGLRQANPKLLIGVTGCVAQQEREKLLQNPNIDLVLGPDNLGRVGELVRRAEHEGRAIATEWVPKKEDYPWIDADPQPGQVSAFVTIMKGCNNVCSFCIVPYVRGAERSRAPEEIVREVARHVSVGAREVMLLGQNVNSYNSDVEGGADFTELLRRVDKVPGLRRLRYTTSHPKDFNERLADAMAELPTVCEYLHLPVQSGNDRILDRMRRGYTRAEYVSRIEMLKRRIPDIALSTDIIVGFPGETEEEFQDTLSLLRELEFDSIFPFEYSPRPHTAAIKYSDEVPRLVMRERFQRMLELQKEITFRKNRAVVGRRAEILVEGPSLAAEKGQARQEGGGTTEAGAHLQSSAVARQLQGRTRQHKIVHFVPPEGSAEALRGRLVQVDVIGAFFNSLRGELVAGEAERALREAAEEATLDELSALVQPADDAAAPRSLGLPVLQA